MVVRKKPASRGSQSKPKKGTLRLQLSSEKHRGTHGRSNIYTPKDQQDAPQPRRGREAVTVTGEQLRAWKPKQLHQKLCEFGHVPDLKNSRCLKCGQQSLATSLKGVPGVLAGTGAAAKRCTSKHCNVHCHPLLEHPVLVLGRGSDTPPLSKQAKLMWHAAWNAPPRQVRADMGLSEKCVAAAYTRWRKVLKKWVEHKQAAIKVGGDYKEIEADEVVIRKKNLQRNQVQWYEYVGLKQRGEKESLILEKRSAVNSVSKRAQPVRPGKKGRAAPPPLKSEEWAAIAKEHVKNKTILHVDGAVAYATKIDGLEIRRDTVDHGCRHGGPYYTKKAVHRGLTGQPPGKNKKATLAGTQTLDGFWDKPKLNLRGIKAKDEERVDERVRQSQWMHWIGSNDPFIAQGQVLKNVRELELCAREMTVLFFQGSP